MLRECGPKTVDFSTIWGFLKLLFFISTRILKFQSQLTFAFFPVVNRLSGQTEVYFNGFKRSWFVICGFRSVLCVSVFQGSLLVIVVMIDGSEKTYLLRRFLNFRVHVFLKSAVRIVERAYGNKIRGVELSKKKRKTSVDRLLKRVILNKSLQ